MTLDSIFSYITLTPDPIELKESAQYLKKIDKKPFYIEPNYNDIEVCKSGSKFVMFTAPGATGKTVLAKYIANKYKGLYWDLSKNRIGDNIFIGTLVDDIGVEFKDFLEKLKNKETVLVIDAFDEAEMISGRTQVEHLICEINKYVSSDTPSVVLMTRTETAHHISDFCTTNNIPLNKYEIKYISEANAKQFIKKFYASDVNPTYSGDHNDIISQYIDQTFSYINKFFGTNNETTAKEFLGYAPVLQAIAYYISSDRNTANLINNMQTDNTIMIKIMSELLKREQKKVADGLLVRSEKFKPIIDTLYSDEEQIVRLLNYIIYKDAVLDNYPVENLPVECSTDYQEVLETFLPQHPFIHLNDAGIIDFTSPAFTDYCVAYLLGNRSENSELVNMYFEELKNGAITISELFLNYYVKISNGCINSKDMLFVSEALNSKRKYNEKSSIIISTEFDDEADNNVSVSLELLTNDGKSSKENYRILMEDNKFFFDSMYNVTLDVPFSSIEFGKLSNSIILSDSSVFCEKINFNVPTITFNAKETDCVLVSDRAEGNINNVYFNETDENKVKITCSNIRDFPKLYPKRFDYSAKEDLTSFAFHLNRIFNNFRCHSKDVPARMAEKIDFLMLNDPFRKSIFEFLLELGVVYKSGHLYKLDMDKVKSENINWTDLRIMETEAFSPLHKKYLNWLSCNQ